jgi:hypothetical protein
MRERRSEPPGSPLSGPRFVWSPDRSLPWLANGRLVVRRVE